MWKLLPESPLGRLYELYRNLGGDPHEPIILPAGRLLRKLFIWLPLRWLFVPDQVPRMPAVLFPAVIGLVIWDERAAMGALGLWIIPLAGFAVGQIGERLAARQSLRDIRKGCRFPVGIL